MGNTQISVSGMLTVPENKPDIQSILRTATTPFIDKTITTRKKILFYGHVDIDIEYLARTPDSTQPIHFLHCEIPFNGLLFHHDARERYHSFLLMKMRFVKTEVCSPRTLNAIILLKLCKIKFVRKQKSEEPIKPACGDLCKIYVQNFILLQQPICEKTTHENDTVTPLPYTHEFMLHSSYNNTPALSHNSAPYHNSCDYKSPCPIQDCHVQQKYDDNASSHNDAYHLPHAFKPSSFEHKSQQYGNQGKSNDDFYVPTSIQPYKKSGNSRGVVFGFNYEE